MKLLKIITLHILAATSAAVCSMTDVKQGVEGGVNKNELSLALATAVFSGDEDEVQTIISQLDQREAQGIKNIKKEVINLPSSGFYNLPPLLVAAATGHLEILKLLQKNGANIRATAQATEYLKDQKDAQGKNLFTEAEQNKQYNALELALIAKRSIPADRSSNYLRKNAQEVIEYLKPILAPSPVQTSEVSFTLDQ